MRYEHAAAACVRCMKERHALERLVRGLVVVLLATAVQLTAQNGNDPEFETFLQNWLTLKRSTGTFEELYDYWILGQSVKPRRPRWSIMRNVLGWNLESQ